MSFNTITGQMTELFPWKKQFTTKMFLQKWYGKTWYFLVWSNVSRNLSNYM